jgi:hypothetical protein
MFLYAVHLSIPSVVTLQLCYGSQVGAPEASAQLPGVSAEGIKEERSFA